MIAFCKLGVINGCFQTLRYSNCTWLLIKSNKTFLGPRVQCDLFCCVLHNTFWRSFNIINQPLWPRKLAL